MTRRLITISLSFLFLFSLISSSGGLESNANKDETTPDPKDQRPYTRDNAVKPVGQGGYYGGHDTITSEGMLLKEQVHNQTDADGGIDFRNKMVREGLPNLRAGAHDEDTSLQLNRFLNDPPIGPNGYGDFFQHFYNPDLGTGLKNVFNPATKKAMDYVSGAKIMLCKIKKSPSDKDARERLYDYLGRIMHLLQDTATPSHTKNDIHVFTKPFENYVNDHWNGIVNSDAFKNAVTPKKYLEGNYGNLPNINNPVFNPDQFMKTLADISRRYYGEEELIDQIIDPYTGALTKEVNTERLMKNVHELIPEAVKNTAGYIDSIYDYMNKIGSGEIGTLDFCNEPPDPPSPSNDHPDDRFDVSDEFYWEKNYGISEIDLTDLNLRTAIKKGKIGVWYKKQLMEIFIEGRTIYKDAPQETKDAIEEEFQSIGRKLNQRINQAYSDWKGAPDVALFANGFYNPSTSLMLKIGEPVSFQRIDFDPTIVRDHPVMLVPTGGFYGLKNSKTVKALLDDYVKNGGTLVVLTQQHGYDWDLLPVPISAETGERKSVMGYGYQEDQSCQFNSVYIDTYHPMLSAFSTSTANIGVDGYFSSYPDNSTILLRRVANGQPAMIMYPYGNGYVIAAAMYTDFAFTHNQTNQTEINFIQNMISWAKKPESIVEVSPGQSVDLNINVSNFMDIGATSLKFTVLDQARKIVGEQTHLVSVPAEQSAAIPVTYTAAQDSPLGIYHIDYILYDSSGKIIQPQAETDSGRFAVSNPPVNEYKPRDLLYSVNTSAEQFVQGESIPFTVTLWNNSDFDKRLRLYWDWFHTPPTLLLDEVTVEARGTLTRNYAVAPYSGIWSSFYGNSLRLWIHFFEENGAGVIKPSWVNVNGESWPYAGSGSKGVSVIYPSAAVSLNVDKPIYAKGETVTINGSIKNTVDTSWQTNVRIAVYNPGGISIFDDSKTLILPPSGTGSVSTGFTLPPNSMVGSYGVSVYVQSGAGWYGGSAYAPFELPESKISISPNLASGFNTGNSTLPFTITNTGRINVSSGILDLSLKAPDGSIVYSGSQPIDLTVGGSKTLDIPISIPPLKLGNYVLTYSQSDETGAGNPTSVAIPNYAEITNLSFDRTSHKIRETANLSVALTNRGKFNLENISVTVSAPDVNFAESHAISLEVDSSTSLNFAIPIPETVSAGLHNVSVTMILPGGDSVIRNAAIYVAPSSLSVSYQGGTTFWAGDTMEMNIENSGGVDSDYEAYIYFSDQGYWFSDSKSATGSIQTGAQSLLSYTLADQLTNGEYILGIEVIDKKTNKTTSKYTSLNITGLSGELSVRTDKDIYFSNEESTTLSTILNRGKAMVDGNLHLEIVCAESASSPPAEPAPFHIFTEESYNWVERRVLTFPPYFDRQEIPLPISPDQWGTASVRIQHEGDQLALIDYIALKDGNGNLYSPWFVGVPERRDYTEETQVEDGLPADVTGENLYASWDYLPSGVSYQLVMTAREASSCGIVWGTDTAINQGSGVTETLNIPAGNIGQAGKFYLRGELTNGLGQSLGRSYYPFYIIDGDTVLLFNTDKRIYKPGETATITGKVENRAPVMAENLILTLTSNQGGQSAQVLLTETINLLSGGTYPFAIATAAGEEGIFNLSGTVKQNNQTLVSITDQYEVANPLISTYVDAPQTAGNEPFTIELDIYNDGKVDATVQFELQSSQVSDSQAMTIPAGEMKIFQYSQQISNDVTYTFTFAGDHEETITKMVTYGLGASIQIKDGSSALGVFAEGSVAIPVTITNTGQSTETLEVTYQLNPGAAQQSKAYSLPAGGSTIDTLYFNLAEGDYQISATSQKPDASTQANLSVRKENQVQMGVSFGTQTDGLVPVNVNLTNGGFNEISGSVSLSVTTDSGQVIWSGEQALSQLSPQNSQLLGLNINPSAIDPGNYNVQVTLLSNSNEPISTQSTALEVQAPTFQITQLPPYQTFNSGQEATFTFRVKNTGNQEGSFDLRLKAYDLIDSTRREWLKPNEEKNVIFGFMLPEDLEEKDYFASYELKAQSSKVTGVLGGQIKYHLAGISLDVNAALDKPHYAEGETAHLTINIQSPNSNPQNLFARVNYAGNEPQQTFTLSGNQVLIFDIPLPKITGEKLFYGIYHEGGRSIHLNSVYIHKAGDVITIATDKQVYNPGEVVSVSISGNARGDMTLSGLGGYSETLAFTGLITKTFNLPSSITAGTYFINVQLTTLDSELINEVYPFDVAGIQVKVLECQNDKGKYASSDDIATSFTVSSNTSIPAILKAWIVDPTGQYASVGEQNIALSSSENSLITFNSALTTSVSGIHRLVYGIYGPEDLLLCSGSDAFDVGNAVLLGISTDKVNYSQGNESVVVKAGLYGSVAASLEFYLDGLSAGSQPVSLNGFSTINSILPSVTPGPHTLKAVLTAGGLTSTKETTFTYGSGLPDLTLRLSWDQVIGQSSLNVSITAVNQGKSPSGTTTLDLYDGEISGGRLLITFDIPTLSQGESQILTFELNLLGRAGANTLSAIIDPSNTVYEFNESNNRDQIDFPVPEITLSATLEKDAYFAGETVPITSLITNLSKDPLAGFVLSTEVKDQAGVWVFTTTQNIPPIEGMTIASLITSWSSDPNLPEGVYAIRQSIVGKEVYTQKSLTFIPGKDFTITTDAAIKKIEVGETAEYHLQLTPLKAFKGEIHLSLSGYPQNSTAYFTPNPITITEGQAQSILTVNSPDQAAVGSYSMKVNAAGGGMSHSLDLSLNLTDFEMVLLPTSQTLPQIDNANYTITLNTLNGFDHGVTVEVNDIPPGMRASLSAKEVVLPQSLTLSLETSKWLLPGEYRIPIVAKARIVTHTLTAILIVQRNALNVPGIVTVPGLVNKPIIHTFNLSGGLLTEFQVADGGLGVNISAGDVDGDGVDEVIAATGWKLLKPGRLGVFRRDGMQVAVMETEHGYVSDLTVAAGDFDGDWIEEVVLGFYKSPLSDPFHGGGGVKVYKVMENRFIDTGLLLQPYQNEGYFGPPNLTVSDVDGDGVPELITAPGPDLWAPAKIKVYKIDTSSGVGQWRLGSQLMDFIVPFNVNGFGAHVAAGDLDGDGRAEIMVGAGPDPRKKAEVVIVYHGDGEYEFERFTAYQGLLFGVNIAATDMDGDGISEILTGPGPDLRAKSKVRIFRKDGTLIKEFQAYPDNIRFGVKVSTGRIGE